MKTQSTFHSGSVSNLLTVLICGVFISEGLVMLLHGKLSDFSDLPTLFLDSSLLLFVMFPIIYFFLYLPMTVLNIVPKNYGNTSEKSQRLLKNTKISQELFSVTEAILASIHNGILVVDHKGRVIRTNAIFEKMWRIPEELMALKDDKTLIDYIIDQLAEPEKFLASVSDLYGNPEAETKDEVCLKDGHIFERISKPLYFEGAPNGRVWSFLDITESKHVTVTIDNERLLLRTLIDNIPDSIYCKDLDCRKTLVNSTEVKFLGLSSEAEILGKDDFDFYPRELAQGFFADDQMVLKSGVPVLNREEFIPGEDGQKRWILTSKLPLRNKDGQVIGLLGIGRDITKRRTVEELLHKSEEQYRTIVDNIGEGVGFLNADEQFEFANSAAERIFGVPPGQLVGKNLDQFLDKSEYYLIRHETAKRMLGENSVYELGIIRPTGEKRTIIITAVSRIDPEKGFLGTNGVFRDITGTKEAEAAIKLKNEQLLRLNAEKDKFFSIISHDLRGPFNGFLGFTHILVDELDELTMDEIRGMAIDLKNSASSLFRLLENLLLWSRINQGSIPFNPEDLILLNTANESIGPVIESAKMKGITLDCSIPSNLTLFADKNSIQLIFRNLVSNAVKFTPKGGSVALSAEITGDKTIVISIKDSGIGMAPSMVANLFRLDIPTNRSGTDGEASSGLGLILCKEFIEKQGGELWVESEVGKGSVFYFTVPGRIV